MQVRQFLFSLALFVVVTPFGIAQEEFVFAFPPRDAATTAQETYEPIAALLSRVVGKPVVLRYTDNWLTYQKEMKADEHDLVFDAPAFIGWRVAKFGHVPLAKLQGELMFSVIVGKDDRRIHHMSHLAGRQVCAFPPPNMATLFLYNQFSNPARQPVLVHIDNFKDAYQGLLSGRCQAAVIPAVMVQKLDRTNATRSVHQSNRYPNPGFSASPRIPPELRQKIAAALLSPEGAAATATLRAGFGGQNLTAVADKEYDGLGVLLRDIWGLEL